MAPYVTSRGETTSVAFGELKKMAFAAASAFEKASLVARLRRDPGSCWDLLLGFPSAVF
jgi:hypothetical protein